MKSTNQMNGLYPIIRRVRRPLMPTDVLPDGHQADAKPTSVPVEGPDETGAQTEQPNEQDAETKQV